MSSQSSRPRLCPPARSAARARLLRLAGHPLLVLSLVVLVLNDHVLKGSGLLPGALTGKLSDVFGLVVAPWVLLVVVGADHRRAVALAHVAVGAGFALINVSPLGASLAEALTAWGPFPWTITVDPTDLLALAGMPLAARALYRPAAAGAPTRTRTGRVPARPLQQLAFGASLLGCVATSTIDGDWPTEFPDVYADLMIGNESDRSVTVRIRQLKASVVADCDLVQQNPSDALARQLFEPGVAWAIEPGRAVPARGEGIDGGFDPETGESIPATQTRPCYAVLVDGTDLPMTLFFWKAEDIALDWRPSTTDASDLDDGGTGVETDAMVLITGPETGALSFSDHFTRFAAPPEQPAPQTGVCRVPSREAALDWSEPAPYGTWEVSKVSVAPDGCHGITLDRDIDTQRFFLCAGGGDPLPLAEGESVNISSHFGDVDGLVLETDNALISFGRGNTLVENPTFAPAYRKVEECVGDHDECGSYVLPVSVEVATAAPKSDPDLLTVGPGETIAFEGDFGPATLQLIRAFEAPVYDSTCSPIATGHERYIESMYIEEKTQ